MSVWPENTRLLLVEDNYINQVVAQGAVGKLGLESDVVENGQEALAVLKDSTNNPYTLILMDCQMPIMDGYKTSLFIRAGHAGEANINIPIIAMTANAMKGDKEKCLAAGMSDYISKPMDADKLENVIKKWVFAENKHGSSVSEPDKPLTVEVDKVWNEDILLDRIGGKKERLAKVIALSIEDISRLLDDLVLAVEQIDVDKMKKLSHAIKGVAANISAFSLQQSAVQFENAVKTEGACDFSKLLSVLLGSFDELKQRLLAYQVNPE